MEIKEIAAMLDKYPGLKDRLKEMFDLVESPNRGEFSTVDAIEMRTVGVVRRIGKDLLENWSQQQSNQASLQMTNQVGSAKKHVKKNFTGKVALEKSK